MAGTRRNSFRRTEYICPVWKPDGRTRMLRMGDHIAGPIFQTDKQPSVPKCRHPIVCKCLGIKLTDRFLAPNVLLSQVDCIPPVIRGRVCANITVRLERRASVGVSNLQP